MPATAARASFIKSEFRIVKNGPNATVVAKYGESARRTKETIPTYFEDEADAQAMCDERAALLSGELACMFAVDCGVIEPTPKKRKQRALKNAGPPQRSADA